MFASRGPRASFLASFAESASAAGAEEEEEEDEESDGSSAERVDVTEFSFLRTERSGRL